MTKLNYANQNLQNYSFQGQDLTGADFSGADLQGCNFTGATLIGANFEGVQAGQSRRQMNILIATTIISLIVLVGFSAIAAQILAPLLNNPLIQFFSRAIPVLAILLQPFLPDMLLSRFPKITTFLFNGAIVVFLAMMVMMTIGLTLITISSLITMVSFNWLWWLLMTIVSALLTYRIFQWLRESIQSYPGTSFRKANLTDANFSHALLPNTDFSFAVLTGACIFNWRIKPYTQFTKVDCEYLYLQPADQNRQPAEGNFSPSDLEKVLTSFTK